MKNKKISFYNEINYKINIKLLKELINYKNDYQSCNKLVKIYL